MKGEVRGERQHPDQLEHVGKVLQAMGCGHSGRQLQFDQARQGQQGEVFAADRGDRRIREDDGFGRPSPRV